jgi:hypothetical protein
VGQDSLIRLFGGKGGDVKTLMDLAGKQKPLLDLTDQQIKSYQDLDINVRLVSGELKTWAERLSAETIPSYETLRGVARPFEGGVDKSVRVKLWEEQHAGDRPNPLIDVIERGLGARTDPEAYRNRFRVHLPVNNPPLNSTIDGGAAINERPDDSGIFGGVTRVGIFTPRSRS